MTQFWRVTTHADFALLGNIVEHLDEVAPESMTSWSLFDEGDIARLDLIFDIEPDLADVRRFANIPDSMDLTCEKMPDEDWVRLSLAGLKPVEGGRFTLFGAHDRDAVAEGQIGIEIEEPFCILPIRPLCDMCEREVVGAMAQALRAPDFKPAAKK